jgi:hypothetical protein
VITTESVTETGETKNIKTIRANGMGGWGDLVSMASIPRTITKATVVRMPHPTAAIVARINNFRWYAVKFSIVRPLLFQGASAQVLGMGRNP